MFFILSKILSFLINPLIWIFCLLLFSAFSKQLKHKKISLLSALFLLLFFSNSFIINQVFQCWEVPATNYENMEKYDVGIVLGGMATYDPTLDRLQFQRGMDRLLQAIELYKKSYVKKILFVGGSGSLLHKDEKEGLWIEKYLLTLGIPREDFLIESESRNTRENALFAKKTLEVNNINGKYLLITSAFHMRRSLACFKKVGLQVTPYSTDRYSGPPKFDLEFLLVPNIASINGWEVLLHELFGYLTYKVSGYI